METTPEEFRWALAPPDLAAWSSERDREAMPNIRQRRRPLSRRIWPPPPNFVP